jgi:hypothetical protein
MTQLDRTALEKVRTRVQYQLNFYERRQRAKPLFEAMQKTIEEMMSSFVPNLISGPEAMIRKSVFALEESIEKFPEEVREAEEKTKNGLELARNRTAALRRWLDKLS